MMPLSNDACNAVCGFTVQRVSPQFSEDSQGCPQLSAGLHHLDLSGTTSPPSLLPPPFENFIASLIKVILAKPAKKRKQDFGYFENLGVT